MRRSLFFVFGVGVCLAFLLSSVHAQSKPPVAGNAVAANSPASPINSLDSFGPVGNPAQSNETYQKALSELRKTGGVLWVPSQVWKQIKPQPLQGLIRTPEPPGETKQWKDGAGVTVISADEKHVVVQVPPISGLKIERTLSLEDGDSLPHWSTNPVVTLENKLIYGSISYLDWIQFPVEKGPDRKFYVATIRGLRPGQFVNIHGGPGYGGGVTRACVKSLGYDAEKKLSYVVADTNLDHKAGAIMQNKTNTGLIHMLQNSHNDNQTYDVKVIRNQYAHGDTYMYYCDFNYMSNVHSAAGDENGNCYAAFIRSMSNNFRGKVETIDWQANQLKFTAATNIETLGDSRPIINLNPMKGITQGKVMIVSPHCYTDTTDSPTCAFEGKTYPSRIIKNARTGSTELKMGGLIRGDKDCPWTQEVVGRFFAVTSKDEKTPKGNLRWYMITSLQENSDGTKEIEIQRFWWGAKSAGSPTLYRQDNYSKDGHLRPLEYVIAPGTYVNDVSRAVAGGDRGGQRLVGLAPYREQGSSLDFAKDDPIEQAIGPDPFKPQVFRAWMWEDVPGPFPSTIFDLANNGAASRFSAMTVRGGKANLDDLINTPQQKPAWDNVLVLESAVGVGLLCKADFADAAILFQQPNREQPIKWHYAQEENQPPKVAALTVSKSSGELNFQGGGIRTNGSVTAVQGISGSDTPAKNLRGKNVAVQEKAMSLQIRFTQPEADGDYAVFVEQTWLSNRAISEKNSEGFTVTFEKAAPSKAAMDWMIVR